VRQTLRATRSQIKHERGFPDDRVSSAADWAEYRKNPHLFIKVMQHEQKNTASRLSTYPNSSLVTDHPSSSSTSPASGCSPRSPPRPSCALESRAVCSAAPPGPRAGSAAAINPPSNACSFSTSATTSGCGAAAQSRAQDRSSTCLALAMDVAGRGLALGAAVPSSPRPPGGVGNELKSSAVELALTNIGSSCVFPDGPVVAPVWSCQPYNSVE
jgi:hypothetical protein